MKRVLDYWKRSWKFLKEDSWASFVVTLILAFVIIKFVFFPGLSLITGTSLPLVIVESCSMYHQEDGFDSVFSGSDVYGDYGLNLLDTGNWIFQNGFNKGDVIFVVGAKNIEIGDVIIFNAGRELPIIHRVIEIGDDYYATKGDNNDRDERVEGQLNEEKHISEDQILGKALFKVPFIGWAKLIFIEFGKSSKERGFCD